MSVCFGRTSIFGSTHSINIIASMILVFLKWRDQVVVIKTDQCYVKLFIFNPI